MEEALGVQKFIEMAWALEGGCGTGKKKTASTRQCPDGFMDAALSVQKFIEIAWALEGRCGTGMEAFNEQGN